MTIGSAGVTPIGPISAENEFIQSGSYYQQYDQSQSLYCSPYTYQVMAGSTSTNSLYYLQQDEKDV
jgi:hypothetical protein